MIPRNSHPQKNTLLQFTQANAVTKNCKRVFFSPPQEKLKNKKFPTLQKIKLLLTHSANLTDTASNVNRFVDKVCGLDTADHRTERRASGNMGYTTMRGSALCMTVCARFKFYAFLITLVLPDTEVLLSGHNINT